MTEGRRTSRILFESDAPVVVSSDKDGFAPFFHCPGDTGCRFRPIVDEIAETQNFIGVRFGFEYRVQSRPVTVNIRKNQELHSCLPRHLCFRFGRSHQPAIAQFTCSKGMANSIANATAHPKTSDRETQKKTYRFAFS